MQWVEWGEEQQRRVRNARWMMTQMDHLLALQNRGGTRIAEEGYLRGDSFGRGITMSAWADIGAQPGGVFGSKWVTSRPANLRWGWPRGQAVTVLNAGDSGLPVLVFDGTELSNARTAAFAMAALLRLCPTGHAPRHVVFVGAGRVHELQASYTRQLWPEAVIVIVDPVEVKAHALAAEVEGRGVAKMTEELWGADVVAVATAGAEDGWIPREQFTGRVFLNTSLRDITGDFFTGREVVVDDHALANQPGTPYAEAVRLGVQARPLCAVPRGLLDPFGDTPLQHPQAYRQVVVNAMGCAVWDVGVGYAVWRDTFEKARPVVPSRLDARLD